MITTNGTRLYYHDLATDSFVCFCTLHHRIQAVTGEREAADYYLSHGFERFRIKFKIKAAPQGSKDDNVFRQVYQQWCNKIKSKFGETVYVF